MGASSKTVYTFHKPERPKILLRFVVKKHASSRLHYDIRIELNGVLISFVVVEGPSVDPLTSRPAIRVGDHDLEYIYSERVIPEGHYGAGPTMVWDWGMWSPRCDNPAKALEEGALEFELFGVRLKGRWILVRKKSDQWELTKVMDKHAQLGNPGGLVTKYTNSVKTSRTMEEIRDEKSGKRNQDDQLSLLD